MRLTFIAPAIASATLIGTAMTSGVAAADAPKAAHTAARAASVQCLHVYAKESVKIRVEREVNSTALGLFDQGESACLEGKAMGGKYTFCGRVGIDWLKITSDRGVTGWIPAACKKGS
ncbi:SH3 domain-containing protein [Streptomyces chattanoogensis]|uniref:SH3b domain-containing protein n=1 Tax=Streptomyces chattanoogensis TaxID=66876 RepID=A0A0N0GYD4_9ACTN|nr:hypothetical protein [Streptomyces chattanoogensis]KPC61470.1 hypothetical protein ADL29_24750 [Streptomyces chattanoogensis]